MANKSGVLSSTVRQVEVVDTPVGCFNELSFCFGKMSQISRNNATAFGTAVANILIPPVAAPAEKATVAAVAEKAALVSVAAVPEKGAMVSVDEVPAVPAVPEVPEVPEKAAVPSAQDVRVAERAVSVSSILQSAPPLPDSPATDMQDTPPPNKTPLEPTPLHTSQESRKPNHRRHRYAPSS